MRARGARAWALGLVAILGGCSGLREPEVDPRPFSGTHLRVAALDEAGLIDLVGAQRGEWAESREAEVTVFDQPLHDLKDLQGVDVVLFPGDRLGDLVDAGTLLPIPDSLVKPAAPQVDEDPAAPASPDAMAYTDIVPAYREQVIAYGGERMALPLGGSVLVLVYRREAMERRDNLAAAEQAGIALEVPETWDKLDALARFFHDRDWDGDGEAEAGLAFALGPDDEGVGTDILVARAAALGQHRDHFSFLYNAETMEPRIASPPFVTALEALVALKEAGPPELPRFDAEAARSAFRSGAAALLIDRAERAADWIDPDAPQLVGVAPLPGSTRVFEPDRRQWEEGLPSPNRPSYLPRGGGWLVGVVSASASRAAALDFAAYLASSETSGRIFGSRDLPMIPVRSSLLGRGLPDPTRAKGVDGRRWSEAIQKTLLADRVVVGLRVPGGVADHRDLEAARVAAVGGEPAESALRSAERQWAERTDAYGRDRRRWHYRRGLNSLSTAPEPPPRGGAETR